MNKPLIYLIGSLRNPEIPHIGLELRTLGFEVFDDYMAAGPEADDYWRDYEQQLGHTYSEALQGAAALHVFTFDEFNLNRCHGAILIYPAGKSAHLELGYMSGQGKPTFILLDKLPERYDVMKQFATGGVYTDLASLKEALSSFSWPKLPDMPIIYQHEIMWLAGLLEGEGCFTISKTMPRLMLQMTDLDVVTKAAKILDSAVWGNRWKPREGRKHVWACGTSGLRAIEWMRILRPYMGIRRQKKMIDVAETWLKRKSYRKNDDAFWASVFNLATSKDITS